MKTVEEILHNEYYESLTKSSFDIGDHNRNLIKEAMKEYAVEVAREALKNASKNVKLGISEYRTREDGSIGWVVTEKENLFIINDGCNICATEESILNEDNIPEL